MINFRYKAIEYDNAKQRVFTKRLLYVSMLVFILFLVYIWAANDKHLATGKPQTKSFNSGDVETQETKSFAPDEEAPEIQASEDNEEYPDGEYCATVEYFNPNTGTSATYELTVEVETNELISIYWPNGGQLDTHHFCCAEFDENGYTSFTSDKGYDFEIQIYFCQ